MKELDERGMILTVHNILKLNSPAVGRCPKHGDVTERITVSLDTPERGAYCLVCYAEWLAANITRLEVLPDDI